MKRTFENHSFLCLSIPMVILFSLIVLATSRADAQKFSELPGYANFVKAMSSRRFSNQGTVRQIKWAKDFSKFSFVGAKGKKMFDLSDMKVKNFEAFEEFKPKPAPLSRRRTPVPRAEQRQVEPSNDGKWNAIYKDFNLKIVPVDSKSKKTIVVTKNGNERLRYGTGCWVYGEELDQQTAMWWSPNDKYLAFYEVNEEGMRDYVLTTKNIASYPGLLKVRYPKAGDLNPKVAILIYDLKSAKTLRVKIEGDERQYLYNVRWTPSGKELLINRTNRRQNQLDVIAVDPVSGKTRIVVSESQKTWQENSPLMRFLKDGKRFVWETEKNGWKNYELRHLNGKLLHRLSKADSYPVSQILKIDEEQNWIYFSAFSAENPYNKQLHRVRLDGSEHRRITTSDLNHTSIQISPDHKWVIATGEDLEQPPRTFLYRCAANDADKEDSPKVITAGAPNPKSAGKKTGELFSFIAVDGKTRIYGTLHKPTNFDPKKKYPLLIDVYGGPGSGGITNRYRPINPYCEFGYCIAKIGNRGTVGRGKAFESANYLKLGGPDLQDQADGVRFLSKREYIDGSRVGIYGHSYGGYMSALALLRFPKTFHVGVAGAPVTKWNYYDTIYTERYMRTPKENPDGYKSGSCMEYVKNLEGKLLLVHGLIDDNVHPANTWGLVDALHKADKRFDLQIYPGYKHGIGSTYSALRWEYFHRHLKPQP